MKAIITDLDRTLLHTDKTISSYTIAQLEKCRSNNMRVMAATARPLRSIVSYCRQIQFDAVVTLNGAVVTLPQKTLEAAISRESGEKIIAVLLRDPDVLLSIETSEGLYANQDIPEWHPVVYGHFPKIPENVTLYKILASSATPRLYNDVGHLLTEDVYYTLANQNLIQVMSADATKWNGIKSMLNDFGISPMDAVYFGDDYDDAEPIKKCGLGVAVANAIPSVLEAADQVTDSNDQDGVARFLEKNILNT